MNNSVWSILVTTPWLYWTLAGVMGLLVGSFLNVVILRWPERIFWRWTQEAREHLGIKETPEEVKPDDLVMKGSRCPQCRHDLSWWENIPLLSYLILRGACRSCKTSISFQYPLVEALGALVSIAAVWAWGPSVHAVTVMMMGWALLALSGIDMRTMFLPDPLVYIILWAGLLLSAAGMVNHPLPPEAILGAAGGYLSLWTIYWLFKLIRGKEGMGYGDFKLLAAIGAWTGPKPLLTVVIIATVSGVVASIFAMSKGAKGNTPIPFGPWLALGGFIEVLVPGGVLKCLGVHI